MEAKFKIYSLNSVLYKRMLEDIKKARRYIYLETFIFSNDKVGIKFRNLLTDKVKDGVRVKLILDSYGSSKVDEKFFKYFLANGGQINFFQRFRFGKQMLKNYFRRDHRKILVIDDKITYVGSANIETRVLNWRDLTLRIEDPVSKIFRKIFIENFKQKAGPIKENKKFLRTFETKYFDIIRDLPSLKIKNIRKEEVRLLKEAKKNIYIETPFFIPSRDLRKILLEKMENNVKVTILSPRDYDIKLVGILAEKYLGEFQEKGAEIRIYKPSRIHSKLMVVDSNCFLFGSANLDYRSLFFQFEIDLLGNNKIILNEIQKHAKESLKASFLFDLEKWKTRGALAKITEYFLKSLKKFV